MKKILRKSERGQAIILIAFAVVGLVAMVGLMTDTGILLIEYGRLKRGIDAASIAAAQQFRKDYDPDDLENAARQFLTLNQSDVFDIQIYTCTTATAACTADPTDTVACTAVTEVCTVPVRKLVKVIATRQVRFGFLRVIGITETDITASSIGEAASIDLVMVIDTSASMAYATSGNPNQSDFPGDDPAACNLAGTCEPLESVKAVALQFLNTMFIPYDRVAIIASTGQYGFTGTGADQLRDPTVVLHLDDADTEAAVIAAVTGLKVFQPVICTADGTGIGGPPFGTCLNYDGPGGAYSGTSCPLFYYGSDMTADGIFDFYDPSSCPSSNLGGSLVRAAAEYSLPPVREDAFWATIMLAGGAANATDAFPLDGFPYGYCPSTTWTLPFCLDPLASTRHSDGDPDYDADDYARDAADFLADPVTGQGVTIFTIGLGNLVQNATVGQADMGEQLLSYMALEAGDSSGVIANHGTYNYSPDAAGLAAIFQAIADNIFTRLSQ